jgi:flagella basal body P-ring formation protein FlgA
MKAAGLVIVLAGLALQGDGPRADRVLIRLRESAAVSATAVRLGDVATLEGGPDELRRRLAGLDLTDIAAGTKDLKVTRAQVDYRLRLADLDPRLYELDGPAAVTVSYSFVDVEAEEVVAAARQAVVERLNRTAQDVATYPWQQVRGPFRVPGTRDSLKLQGEPRCQGLPVGKVRVDVAIVSAGERRQTVSVYLDVKVWQPVPVTARTVEKGELLDDANVRFERRAVEYGPDLALTREVVLGQRARRSFAAGLVLTSSQLESADGAALVRQRDTVRLVARVGPLRVTAVGEALQDGRLGQRIRVRNIDSKATVQGRVVDRGLVEVDY